ncbi:MAG: hypothetical protein ACO1O1_03200 [Adhaeribacter sp.]
MKKILFLLLALLPLTTSAQEILGKKKKYIDSIKPNSDLIIDTPEMSIWNNKSDNGSLYLICFFKDDKCYKTQSIYPEERLNHWETILNTSCGKVKGQDKLWLDPKRRLFFRIIPGENRTFVLESTKSNE